MANQFLQSTQRTVAFLHFFDVQFLDLKRAFLNEKEITEEARIATRFALLYADEILIPAASFFETRVCRQIILELNSIFNYGVIWLVGAAANIEEFVFNKKSKYDTRSSQHHEYRTTTLNGLPPFRTRNHSATRDIKNEWKGCLNSNHSVISIAEGTKYILPNDFEDRWERVPDALEEKAFVVRYVAPLLFKRKQHPTIMSRLHYVINEAYFMSYVKEYQACTVDDLIYLASPHNIPSCGPKIPFRKFLQEARRNFILNDLIQCDAETLLTFKKDDRWVRCVFAVMNQQSFNSHITTGIRKKGRAKSMDSLHSFIVHGHDDTSKLWLKDYLQNTLQLPEPIILHQQPKMGRSVIEKFEELSEKVDVAFILLTPDDMGGLVEEEQKKRARQNVIFELGFFVGKFGRKSGRVILLYKGNLDMPSDLAGVFYINISNGIEAAGEEIRRELNELKCL